MVEHPTDGPAALEGTLTLPERSVDWAKHSGNLDLKITSGRGVLLFIISVEVPSVPIQTEPPRAETYTGYRSQQDIQDFFFSSEDFAAGAIQEFHQQLPPTPELANLRVTSLGELKPTGKVLFVQFADGSAWGDSDSMWTKNALRDRALAWHRLRKLLETYNSEGEQAFVAELTKRPANSDEAHDFLTPAVSAVKDTYEKTHDVGTTVEKLKQFLTNADSHMQKNKELRFSGLTSKAPPLTSHSHVVFNDHNAEQLSEYFGMRGVPFVHFNGAYVPLARSVEQWEEAYQWKLAMGSMQVNPSIADAQQRLKAQERTRKSVTEPPSEDELYEMPWTEFDAKARGRK